LHILSKIKEWCAKSPHSSICNLHVFCIQHESTSSPRQLWKHAPLEQYYYKTFECDFDEVKVNSLKLFNVPILKI
jgi:hypothetical protein